MVAKTCQEPEMGRLDAVSGKITLDTALACDHLRIRTASPCNYCTAVWYEVDFFPRESKQMYVLFACTFTNYDR